MFTPSCNPYHWYWITDWSPFTATRHPPTVTVTGAAMQQAFCGSDPVNAPGAWIDRVEGGDGTRVLRRISHGWSHISNVHESSLIFINIIEMDMSYWYSLIFINIIDADVILIFIDIPFAKNGFWSTNVRVDNQMCVLIIPANMFLDRPASVKSGNQMCFLIIHQLEWYEYQSAINH